MLASFKVAITLNSGNIVSDAAKGIRKKRKCIHRRILIRRKIRLREYIFVSSCD